LKAAIVRFPGSNCDQDCHVCLRDLGVQAEYVWHKEESVAGYDFIVLPGGFSYGDYLRCGAIARFSPVMKSVIAEAKQGKPVLGICNGFQILCEAHLLPGALVRNRSLHFICEHVRVRVENTSTVFTAGLKLGQILRIPIAHGEGNYFAPPDVIERLERNRQVVFRYVDAAGTPSDEANPNGSVNNIAGICNEARNVVGLMPHPERACELAVGSADGLVLLQSAVRGLGAASAAVSTR
jgi:phosphoribosylformylglycinamidine synthase